VGQQKHRVQGTVTLHVLLSSPRTNSLSHVGAGAGAATCINSGVPSCKGHAAHQNPGIVSAGLGARGPEGGAAKSKSTGGPQPRAESKVDKTVVATLGQLSAHFAIWRASKDGYLRISSNHGAPEDIVCSEHAVALMNHIISADEVVPSASTDFKDSYKEPLSVFTKPTSCVKYLLDKEDVKHLSLHILDFRVVSRKILLAIVARDKFLDSDTPDQLFNSPLPPEIGCLPSHVIKWVLHNSYVRIQDSQTAGSGTAEQGVVDDM